MDRGCEMEADMQQFSSLVNIHQIYKVLLEKTQTLSLERCEILVKYLEQTIFDRIYEHDHQELLPNIHSSDLTHSSRILLTLAVFTPDTNLDLRIVEQLYTDLLMGTSRGLQEYNDLGVVLSTLFELVRLHGADVLKKSSFDLPFKGQEVIGLNPPSTTLRVDTLPRLEALIQLWCNVFVTLCSGKSQGNTGRDTSVTTINHNMLATEFFVTNAVPKLKSFSSNAPCLSLTGLSSLCRAIACLCSHTELDDCIRHEIIGGIMEALEQLGKSNILNAKECGNNNDINHDHDGSMNRLVSSTLREVEIVVDAIVHSSSLRMRSSILHWLSVTLTHILQICIVDQFAVISFSNSNQGQVKGRGEDAAGRKLREFGGLLVSSCMNMFHFCLAYRESLLPTLFLLQKCCVDAASLHSCVKLLCSAINKTVYSSELLVGGLEDESRELSNGAINMNALEHDSADAVPSPGYNRRAHFVAVVDDEDENFGNPRKKARYAQEPSPLSPMSQLPSGRSTHRYPEDDTSSDMRTLVGELLQLSSSLQANKKQLTWNYVCSVTLLFETCCYARQLIKGVSSGDNHDSKAVCNSGVLSTTAIDSQYLSVHRELLSLSKIGISPQQPNSSGKQLNMQSTTSSTIIYEHFIWLPLLSMHRILALFAEDAHVVFGKWEARVALQELLKGVIELGNELHHIQPSIFSSNSELLAMRLQSASVIYSVDDLQLDRWLRNGDIASPLLNIIAFPCSPAKRKGSSSAEFLDVPLSVMHSFSAESLLLFLSFTTTHVRMMIRFQLNSQQLSPISHSEALMSLIKFNLRLCSYCLGKQVNHTIVIENISYVMSAAMAVLIRSYSEERVALKKCADHSVALRRAMDALKDRSLSLEDPDSKLSLLYILCLSARWNCALKADTNQVLQSSPSVADSLASLLAIELVSLWKLIKPHIKQINESSAGTEEIPPEFDVWNGVVTSENLAANSNENVNSSSDSASDLKKLHKCCDKVAPIQLLSHFGAVTAGVIACMESSTHTQKSSAKDKTLYSNIVEIRQDIEGHCDDFLNKIISPHHSVSTRLVELTTVCMLSYSFQLGLEPFAELSVDDCLWGDEHKARTAKLMSRKRGGGTCEKHAIHQNNLMGPVAAHIFSSQNQTSKQSRSGASLITLMAHARFIGNSVLINPQGAVWALSQIAYVWAHTPADDQIASIAFGELSALGKKSLLKYLMIANVDCAVKNVILPLLLYVPEPSAAQSRVMVLNCLCSNMLAYRESPGNFDLSSSGTESPRSNVTNDNNNVGHFARFAHAQIMAGLALCPDKAAVQNAKMLLKGDSAIYFSLGELDSLFDEKPFILYRLLMSDTVQQEANMVKIIGSSFGKLLKSCAEKLELPLMLDRDVGSIVFNKTTVQNVMLPLVWDLGSADIGRKANAEKALRVLCTLIRADSLCYQLTSNASVYSDLEDNVAEILSEHFLYIMANLLENHVQPAKREQDVSTETFSLTQRVQCVRCLKMLVSKLRQLDLVRYLPKVMRVMDRVLGDGSSQVRHAGIELSAELVRALPSALLRENLSALVVGLFPSLVQDKWVPHSNPEAQLKAALQALSKFGTLPQVSRIDRHVRDPTLHLPDPKLGLSSDLVFICQTSRAVEVASGWDANAKKKSIQIINSIFRNGRDDMKAAIQSLAYVPDLEELSDAHALHAKETKELTLEQTIYLLCKTFRHDSTHVRVMGLRQLIKICQDDTKKMQLYSQVKNSSTAGGATYGHDTLVSLLLQELLLLACKEREPSVIDAVARALGELGAIDPARVHVALPSGVNSRSIASIATEGVSPRSPRSEGGSPRSTQSSELFARMQDDRTGNPAPWECSNVDMGLLLLERFLVPGMRSAGAASEQDKTSYAIQTILHKLAELGDPNYKNSSGLPEGIRALLSKRNMLDVVEPFWSTSYRIEGQARDRQTPIYHPGIDYNVWIAAWTRHLLSICEDCPIVKMFDACGGLLRGRAELSQFILPHAIVMYLQQHVEKDGKDDEALWEICYVLSEQGGSDSHKIVDSLVPSLESLTSKHETHHSSGTGSVSQMPVQAVFSLLDTLGSWAFHGLQMQKKSMSKSSIASSRVIKQANSVGSIMQRHIDRVPKLLLCFAALRARAHARALRYFELHARTLASSHRLKESISGTEQRSNPSVVDLSVASSVVTQVTPRPADGSNSELPVLKPSQLDLLMSVYSNLEDPDALKGVQTLRQINGYPNMPWARVLELEQTDDWLGALLEYGLLQDASSGNESLISAFHAHESSTSFTSGNPLTNRSSTTKSSLTHNLLAVGTTPPSFRSNKKRKPTKSDAAEVHHEIDVDPADADTFLETDDDTVMDCTAADDESNDGDASELPALHNFCLIEKGRLRCLIELEQLDSVVDQTLGMVQRIPDLEPALLPLGVEATWRLQQWDNLETFLNRAQSLENSTGTTDVSSGGDKALSVMQSTRNSLTKDSFPVSIGRLLLSLHKKNKTSFDEQLLETRRRAMSSLSAASMESYGRAYPQLVRLHILSEIESGYELVHLHPHSDSNISVRSERRSKMLKSWGWDERLNMMSPSARQRSMSLAVRRTLLSAAGMREQVARNWLGQSDTMRQIGHFDAARVALRSAEQQLNRSDSNTESLLQECRILKDSGRIHEALMLIEPVEHNIPAIRHAYREYRKNQKPLPGILSTPERIITFSERLFLATQLMVESKTKQGAAILERYKCIIDLRSRWPSSYFEFARYYEYLYHAARAKEIADHSSVTSINNGSSGRHVSSATSTRSTGSRGGNDDSYEFKSHLYLLYAVLNYMKAIYYGQSEETTYLSMITQALPRMLTLFLSFTQIREEDLGTAAQRQCTLVAFPSARTRAPPPMASGPYRAIDSLRRAQTECCDTVKLYSSKITPNVWFSCLPQLVSRIEHTHRDTVETINHIILKVLIAHPKESVWHVAGLLQSLIPARQAIGDDLVRKASASLGAKGAGDAAMLADAKIFFRNLIDLAVAPAQDKEKKLRWKWPKDIKYERFMVPMQGILTAIPRSAIQEESNEKSVSSISGITLTEMYMKNFDEIVDVASSKAKPKTVYLTTVCGNTIKFLCKQEKNGDLRKDSRMMEFNTAVNRLFKDDAEARRRNLKLRTYAVVCLNEECGILEWVNNTSCLRHLIAEAHSYHPHDYGTVNSKEIYKPFVELQTNQADNLEELVRGYRQLILDDYKPCFHRWFLATFSDPTAWFDARTTFTRSMAVWSVVGYLIGLGDRHTENVLLDTTSGECVHVDFDCIFSKGLTLARPEIVPFRLTPNLVDAMGVTGVEGNFRRTMEVGLTVLQDNKETLMAVLEPFLRDPTVSWGRGGRAQRMDHVVASGVTRGLDHSHIPITYAENADAKEALEKISGRLNGVYNLSNPAKSKICRGYKRRNESLPRFGMGASDDESLPLSVQGQVQRLIDEARAEENLSQMYIGWQPWA